MKREANGLIIKMFIPRGLCHRSYKSVALRAFFIRKDEVLVVQAQEEVAP